MKIRVRATPPARRMYVARRVAGVDAGELERGVRLDRDRQVRRAFEPDRPGAVVATAREQLVREQPVRLRRRAGRGSGAGRDAPRSSSRSTRARPSTSRRDAGARSSRSAPRSTRGVERGELLHDGHAATLVVTSDNTARAAVRPERTALSIVAGQPVRVHAPARASPCSDAARARERSTPGRSAIVASGSRLTRDQSSSASPSRSVTCDGDAVDEVAPAHVHQLRHAARDDGQILAASAARCR